MYTASICLGFRLNCNANKINFRHCSMIKLTLGCVKFNCYDRILGYGNLSTNWSFCLFNERKWIDLVKKGMMLNFPICFFYILHQKYDYDTKNTIFYK